MDFSIFEFLAAPFAASLVIAGIHAYLGVHVVERGVIFVDLALAQIAALGGTVALFIPFMADDEDKYWARWCSLGFTLVGALIFSMVKSQRSRVPHEAIIGISYAVASALTIVAMSQATSETEHLKDMLVGNILAVSWDEVIRTSALYLAIAAFHYMYRDKFFAVTLNPDEAAARGLNVRWWDFLFYASFGVMVTRSVAIAGVLLVFCYLIVPSVAAMLYADRIGPRLAIGWTMGTVVSALGIFLSVKWDLPTGATMVCTFGGVLILMALVRPLILRSRGTA